MSGIVLSASVRQNLLSLQNTAQLLATTQNDLSTGNKVNTALDNPTEFFTAQGLNSRAGDISNLLDSIGNGVQVLQAANTGITSLQSLIANAQSIANQVLQAPTGYTTKSNVTSSAIPGATANNLLGPGINAIATGSAVTNQSSPAVATTAGTLLVGAAGTDSLTLANQPADGSVLKINNNTITFSSSQTTTTTDANGNVTIGIGSGSQESLQSVLTAIDGITKTAVPSTVGTGAAAGELQISTGTTSNLKIAGGSGNALAALGLTALSTAGTPAGTTDVIPPLLEGENLSIAATGNGTATNIVFGTGTGQISTLNQLNTALAANNLQASVDTSGHINISTTNNAASATIGNNSPNPVITGTAVTNAGAAFVNAANGGGAPVADPNSQSTRANLVSQYNEVLSQINTTSQDASFNGINLLNGDTLNLTFDETGASKLTIQGTVLNDAGLSLSDLNVGTDFLDNNSANTVLTQLQQASTTLAGEASSLGSNLSIVEIRQDFNKNLIDVLQTGASNLTLADTNEEAANSQALSTRQSIAVSALALANQSQQSVLQLLR
ncbi:flagellin [Bradyrhizobium sp. S69]|uniref:flagellin N-terminal helical domain-containing protein n=1 Tax=Bradyrhizobium sp. S69 TaxID=1641856 RepID=UPI00131D07C8|nr:flagellin [Bradyrhizobium sp. S69]